MREIAMREHLAELEGQVLERVVGYSGRQCPRLSSQQGRRQSGSPGSDGSPIVHPKAGLLIR
jgi:hypothetical protein